MASVKSSTESASEFGPKFAPEPSRWRTMLSRTDRDPRCSLMRSSLGIDPDRPVIVTGHQAQLWHPGIAGKLFAAHALSEQTGAQIVWLVVDTDTNDPFRIEVPIRDDSGQLQIRGVDLAGPPPGLPVPTASLPPRRPVADPLDGMTPGIDGLRERLAVIREQLAAAQLDAASAADQVTRAALMMLPGPQPTVIFASQIAETAEFAELVDRVQQDPAAAGNKYNEAVEAHPSGGIQMLDVDGTSELPFWTVSSTGGRRPSTAHDDTDATRWPRALAMTGLVRAFACDLFIHGTGGQAYEPINDAWLPDLLDATLAHAVTATATMTLRFDGAPEVTHEDAAHSAWRAHHARHHPQMLGDSQSQQERDAMVRAIRECPRDDPERAKLYQAMQMILDRYRVSNGEALEQLAAEAKQAAAFASESAVRSHRLFPAALFETADLCALANAISNAFGEHASS